MSEPILHARVVRTAIGTLKLRTEDGLYPLSYALPTVDLEDGDVVALVVVQRRAPLPPLNLPLQLGQPYGSPIPIDYAPEARVPDALRLGYGRTEDIDEPVS